MPHPIYPRSIVSNDSEEGRERGSEYQSTQRLLAEGVHTGGIPYELPGHTQMHSFSHFCSRISCADFDVVFESRTV